MFTFPYHLVRQLEHLKSSSKMVKKTALLISFCTQEEEYNKIQPANTYFLKWAFKHGYSKHTPTTEETTCTCITIAQHITVSI